MDAKKRKIVVLTGAGISAESGLQTFRDSDGLWEGYNVYDVATPEAWAKNPPYVQDFYNKRRKGVLEARPNKAHQLLAEFEQYFDVCIITQNIDNLHERGGSSNVLHLHGEITKARSVVDENLVYDIDGWELKMGDTCELGAQLRPFIVWFGEAVPMMDKAIREVESADVFVVVGTSLMVYPAAGLLQYTPSNIPIYIIDKGNPDFRKSDNIQFIQETATSGMELLKSILLSTNNA